MQYARIFPTEDGGSAMQKADIALAPVGFVAGQPSIEMSTAQGATSFSFARLPRGWPADWHPTPRRQFVVGLSGQAEMQTSDGSKHTVTPGTIALLEDTAGKGHHTEVLGESEWCALVIAAPLAADGSQAAREVCLQWADAVNALDLDRLAGMYTEDALLFGSVPELFSGRAAVQRYFSRFPSGLFTARIGDQRAVEVAPNVLAMSGVVDFDKKGAGTTPFRLSFVLVRRDDRWLIAQQHASPRG